MEMDPVEGFAYANWEKGYGDFHLVPDLGTLRPAGWTSGTAFVLCDPVNPAAPSRCPDEGWLFAAASELEFFLFRDCYRNAHAKSAGVLPLSRPRNAHAKSYRDLEAAGWYVEDYHLLQASRVEDYVGAARRAIPVENRAIARLNIRYAEVLRWPTVVDGDPTRSAVGGVGINLHLSPNVNVFADQNSPISDSPTGSDHQLLPGHRGRGRGPPGSVSSEPDGRWSGPVNP